MIPKYSYSAIIHESGHDFEVMARYFVDWGSPAIGPTYDCGGQPEEPPQIIDLEVTKIDGKPADDFAFLSRHFLRRLEEGSHPEEMLRLASEDELAAQDEAADAKREARCDD